MTPTPLAHYRFDLALVLSVLQEAHLRSTEIRADDTWTDDFRLTTCPHCRALLQKGPA